MKMRLGLLAALAVGYLVSSAAQAADVGGYRSAPRQQSYVDDKFDWTGVYIGVEGGGSMTRLVSTDSTGTIANLPDWKGWAVGGHVSARKQIGMFVLGTGLRGIYSGAKFSETTDPCAGLCGAGYSTTRTASSPWLALGEVQAGVALDRALLYISGGVAGGQAKAAGESTFGTFGSSKYEQTNYTLGWTVGGGFEYAVLPNFTLGAQYNYVDMALQHVLSSSTSPWGSSSFFADDHLQQHIVMLRGSFKFP